MADRKPNKRTPSSASASNVGELLVDVAEKVLDADRCSFLVDGGDHFDIVATTEVDPDRAYPKGASIPAQAIDAGIACVIDDRLDTRSSSAAQSNFSVSVDRIRSLYCVPVGNIGLLLGEAYRPEAFAEDEKDLLVRVVDTLLESSGEIASDIQPVEDGSRRLDDPTGRHLELGPELDRLVESYEDEYPNADLALDVRTPVTVSVIDGFPAVLEELIENAIAHNPDNQPKVDITVSQDDSYGVVAIWDTGPPIPDPDLAVLREVKAPTPVVHGSGLGLWLVVWLVRHSNGTAEYTHRDPTGNCISLRLPLAD